MPSEKIIRRKALDLLKDEGWICWFAPKVKFHETDIFGIIDLMAFWIDSDFKGIKFLKVAKLIR